MLVLSGKACSNF